MYCYWYRFSASLPVDSCDPTSRGKPILLIQAMKDAELETAVLLLDHGADVNAIDTAGNTLLHLAVGFRTGETEFVGLLMERRADVGVKNRECDMLHAIAVKKGIGKWCGCWRMARMRG